MPNGRSGGFVLNRDQLERLLGECQGDTAVGQVLRFAENSAAAQLKGAPDRSPTLKSWLVRLFRFSPPDPADDIAKAYSKRTITAITAAELRHILDRWKGDTVAVEEQDHSWYIVHFAEWVTVDNNSPLFDGFRRYHTEALKRQGDSS